MSATNYTLLVARIRTDAHDTATSNPKFGETPAGLRNGTNPVFRLTYPNPVVASIFMTYGASIIRQPAGAGTFSVLDAPSGYLTMLGAGIPDASVTQPFYFDYFFQWFADADYNTMIDTATEELGQPAGTAVVEGLYPALIKYTLSHYWNRRASQYAHLFATGAASAHSDPHAPTPNFAALAKSARAEGDKLRDAYMKGFGANLQPYSGTVTMGMDPIVPRY